MLADIVIVISVVFGVAILIWQLMVIRKDRNYWKNRAKSAENEIHWTRVKLMEQAKGIYCG